MLSFLKRVYKNQTSKNFSALAVVQATNYIFPLITLPYVLNVVGTDKYGAVALAQAFFTYQIIITDFSFNITSSSEVSLAKHDRDTLSRIFSETFSIKILLLVLMFIALQTLIVFAPRFGDESELFNWGFILVIGQALLPVWFFQGIEKLEHLTYINFVSKTFSVVLIFLLVNTQEDYILILALNGLGNLVSAAICIGLILLRFNVRFQIPTFHLMWIRMREGASVFYSNFLVNIIINSNIIILSYFATEHTLGLYTIAEKIVQTIRSVLVVFYQATYPQVVTLKVQGLSTLKRYYKKTLIPFLGLIITGTLILNLFTEEILFILTSDVDEELIFYVRYFSLVPIIVACNIAPNQLLLIYQQKKIYFKIILCATLVNLAGNILLSYFYSATGTITAIIIAETFLVIALYIGFKKINITA